MRFLSKIIPTKQRGDLGEDAAARFLEQKGFRVLERNWRFRQWELDLICRDGDTVVFVEVKTRRAGSMGTPGDALNRKKQARLVKAASQYLSKHDLWDEPCRFDLAAVIDTGVSMDVEHTENAFDLTDHTGGW
ncbi:YraN family protein [Pseudodesulfovibrio sp. zrk46]|uniref:YraN family protein n=1 Tax=Pseudodesulfovibrio sp. zrk46 TaxID=2725288 RepID=UPI001449EE39|nr:YraN family protein [Pseudodesulfovibrio sp. zrk46]QJB56449.1 YraN family protein [Pseudodesulfovibrio sp. zrk46]